MKDELFNELVSSVREGGRILRGKGEKKRTFLREKRRTFLPAHFSLLTSHFLLPTSISPPRSPPHP